jgi:hypothetical protein
MATPTHQPPPKRSKVSPDEEEQQLKVSDLVPGDSSLVEKIIELAKSEEDPPLVFEWNSTSLEAFWAKAVAYASVVVVGGPAIPINGGVNLPVAMTDVDSLKSELLVFVRNQQAPAERPIILGAGGTVGFGCTLLQFGNTVAFLRGLDSSPWFAVVLAHGAPLAAPLATIYTPRPRSAQGLVDPLTIGSPLWA